MYVPITRTQKHQMPYLCIFDCDVTDDVTWVLLGHSRFSSITSEQTAINNRERRHCDGTELSNRLQYATCPFTQPITWRDVT